MSLMLSKLKISFFLLLAMSLSNVNSSKGRIFVHGGQFVMQRASKQ